ncbi:MAG: type IV toxin-antitoxin system AbiEi family antitoxin domain-containing protein [Knoellia sp.]
MVTFEQLPQPFHRAESLRVGLSDRRIERAIERGELIRVAHGLYAVSSIWSSLVPWVRHERLCEAAVRLTPDAIVSHLSDAVLLGLPHPAYEPKKVTMTVLDDVRTSRSDSWRTFHRGETPPGHILILAGRPRLIPARTVIDCCRELHPRDALAVMDGALRVGQVTGQGLRDMRRHQSQWPGVRGADLAMALTDPRRENWFESISAWALNHHGVPPHVPQVNVLTASGRFVGRVDALWPELGIVGEADGAGKYTLDPNGDRAEDEGAATSLALRAERIRENRFHDLGLDVFRWGPRDALAGAPLAERFEAALGRADPARVTARFVCSCCRSPLTDCPQSTGEARFVA